MNSLMLMHRAENPLRSDTFHNAAYALAATMNAPLLFKGGDFAATDGRACL
jgi:uncharacterized protein with PIN domain